MSWSRLITTGLVVAVAAVLFQPLGVYAAGPISPTAGGVTRAIEFRTELGLRADTSFVTAMENDSTQPRAYGIAMTPAEQANVDRRVAIESQLPRLGDAFIKNAQFAGMYIDQPAGGVIDIATTGDPSALADIVAGNAPSGARIRLRHVNYTWQYLNNLQSSLNDDLAKWAAKGIVITQDGIDVAGNRLMIAVAELTGPAAAALESAYGAAISVTSGQPLEPESCTSRAACIPVVGGDDLASSAGGTCTAGFVAWSQQYGVVVVTAGHCVDQVGMNWYNANSGSNGTYIGGTIKTTMPHGGGGSVNADAGFMGTMPGVVGKDNAYYLVNAGQYGYITSVAGYQSTYMGQLVCESGRVSGWSCGTIVGVGWMVQELGYNVYNETQTTIFSQRGDSGAPVVFGSQSSSVLMGILTGITGSYTYYSAIGYVDSSLGIAPCLSANC